MHTNSNKKYFLNARGKLMVLSAIAVFLFWFISLSRQLNIYRYALVGSIFEALWLPVIILTCLLPLISLVFWVQEKFNHRSLYLYTLLILALTGLMIMFHN